MPNTLRSRPTPENTHQHFEPLDADPTVHNDPQPEKATTTPNCVVILPL
jgi:hypothetical protein